MLLADSYWGERDESKARGKCCSIETHFLFTSLSRFYGLHGLQTRFVGIVAADKKPDDGAFGFDAEGAVVVIDADGPEGADALEVK